MKIGFVIGSLDFSGAEKIAKYLIRELSNAGHDVGVLLLSRSTPYSEIGDVKQFPLYTEGNRFIRVLNRQRIIRDTVRKGRFNVIVSFGVKFNLDVMEALRFTDTRVILCERNDPVNDPHRIILRIRRKLCYPFAKGYVFQTNDIANFFGNKIKDKSVIIPNFIEDSLPCLYNAKNDNNIVVTARLDDLQKNISMLIKAFAEFSKTYNYHLYIVGKGPDENKFVQLVNDLNISEKVFFVGHQNVYDYLKIAQIFVLTSNYEGMPNSLIEALASGLPCIATNCSGGGSAYLIDDHINGTLIPVNDVNKLVVALKELADNPELRASYSFEARKINERLKFDKIVGQWISYIEKIGSAI